MTQRARLVAGGALGGGIAAAALAFALGPIGAPPASADDAKTLAEVMKRMKYYNKSLGVECDYCHVPNKFEIDTPKRKTAKWMQDHLVDGLVTKKGSQPIDCHTCHDGRARFLPSSQ